MQFIELMMLYTAPLYWERRPSSHANQLEQLLLFLLDADKPGFGALRVYGISDEGACDWRKGHDAVRWVQETYEKVWLPEAERLEGRGKASNRDVFNLYGQYRAEVFLDEKRLATCLDVDMRGNPHLGLSVNWSLYKSLLWMPQLRICNYWPHNRRLAPPPPEGVSAPSPFNSEDAGNILFQDYWQRVVTNFRALCHRFEPDVEDLVPGPRQFPRPVFFYARPTQMPDEPDKFLSPAYLPFLETLCRTTIGTHDPLSADVIGSLLEGNLLTFRRGVEQSGDSRAYYLMVPWLPAEGKQTEEAEDELCSDARKLALIEFIAGHQVKEIVTDLAGPRKSLALWAYTMDQATSIVKNLQHLVAFKPVGNRRRKMAFKLVQQLHSSLSRLAVEVLTETNKVSLLESQWRAEAESITRFASHKLSARSLPRMAPLPENLGEAGPHKLHEEQVNEAAQQAQQLREHYSSLTTALQHMLDHEHRESQERQERNGRRLSYALAALAAVTAFPILLGQLDSNDIQTEMHKWPVVRDIFGLSYSHLVLVATVSAGVIIVLLVGILLSAFLRLDWWRKGEVSGVGNKIVEIGRLMKEAERAIDEERKDAPLLFRGSSSNESEKVKALRENIDTLDTKTCALLMEVWGWLLERSQAPRSVDDVQALRDDVDSFIVRTELLDNRPVPCLLPCALCLYRGKYEAVSDFEFQQILNEYGFKEEEVKTVSKLIERYKDLPSGEFIDVLRRAGVTTLHDAPVRLPADQPGLADEERSQPSAPSRRRVDPRPVRGPVGYAPLSRTGSSPVLPRSEDAGDDGGD